MPVLIDVFEYYIVCKIIDFFNNYGETARKICTKNYLARFPTLLSNDKFLNFQNRFSIFGENFNENFFTSFLIINY